MLNKRFSPLGFRPTVQKFIKNSLVCSLAYFASTSFKLKSNQKKYQQQYDLAVIGGGSGGLATAFEAAKYGLKVIVVDYVEQTPNKTKWGLGGTCVNVGCIPKKLMHNAAKLGQELVNAYDYGWVLPNDVNNRENFKELQKSFQWQKLRTAVQNYIKSMNFGYVTKCSQDNLQYLNCMATFKDKNTIICSKSPQIVREYVKTGKLPETSEKENHYYEIKAKNFLIATGTRPSYLEIEGSQHAISSDDVFSLKKPPGKTLVVGGGYVAVEIAGFLKGLGFDVTLMTRGDYLRSFDKDMVNHIMEDLKQRKVDIRATSLPKKILKNQETNKLQVVIENQLTKETTTPEVFDTVLFAVGRYATTDILNLDKINVNRSKSKKILSSNQVERTNVDNIYALGDVVEGLPQLTSTAVKMGQHLGRRLAHRINNLRQFKQHEMFISLQNYPTTVFTPVEYSLCGLTEQKAIEVHGRENISVYHIKYKPLEEAPLQKYTEEGDDYKVKVYAKAIVDTRTDKVLGLHYAGPHAGEIMQGFAVAIKLGLTKQTLDQTIGIHPTIAEDLTNMTVTKQSGEEYEKKSC